MNHFDNTMPSVLRWLARVAAVVAAYYLGGRLGLSIPYVGSHITLIWLPTGIAVAALLRWGYAVWPGVFLGASMINLSVGSSPLLALGIAVGNTAGPLLAAWLLRRYDFHSNFGRRRDVALLAAAAMAGMLISASNGVVNLYLAEVMPWPAVGPAWLTWWGGDAIGVLLAAPVLLSLSRAELEKIKQQRGEFFAWAIILLAAAWFAFFANTPDEGRTLPMAFLLLPLVVWSAMRFGTPTTAFATLLLAIISAWGTATGRGTFFLPNPHTGLFLLWAFMVTTLASGLLIASLDAERRRAEEKIKHEHDFRKEMIEALPGIFYLFDTNGRFLLWNKNLETVMHYGPDKIAEMHPLDMFASQDHKLVEEKIHSVFENGQDWVEAMLIAGNGSKIPYYFTGRSILLEGKPVLLGLGIDITERKRAETQLRETQLRLSHIVDTSPTAIYVVKLDPNGAKPPHVAFMSQNITRMVGYSMEELSQPGFWESHIHPADRERAMANQSVLFATGSLQHEYRYRHRDGHCIWIHDQLILERDETGKIVEIVGSWLDITGRKQTEEALQRLNDNLEQRVAEEAAKNREKDHLLIQQSRLAAMGEMIGNIAHQWRQPINALSLLLANISDAYDFGELNKEQLDRQVKTGTRLIQQMSTTIDDFRNFFRPDKEKAPFSLIASLAEIKEILGASLAGHNIILEEDVPRDITVTGYANEYAQALLNVINNAKEAILAKNPAVGRIHIEVREESGMAVVRVGDNGGGIPEDVLPKIFDPYFTTKSKGTGIGLYMAKAIIETNMGGRIEVCNSGAGDGAQFTVAVPLG